MCAMDFPRCSTKEKKKNTGLVLPFVGLEKDFYGPTTNILVTDEKSHFQKKMSGLELSERVHAVQSMQDVLRIGSKRYKKGGLRSLEQI